MVRLSGKSKKITDKEGESMKGNSGWFNESNRHALASKGIRTGTKTELPLLKINPPSTESTTIYKIYDDGDIEGYDAWYGTEKEIKDYLEETAGSNANYDSKKSVWENLENYGLVAQKIHRGR